MHVKVPFWGAKTQQCSLKRKVKYILDKLVLIQLLDLVSTICQVVKAHCFTWYVFDYNLLLRFYIVKWLIISHKKDFSQ